MSTNWIKWCKGLAKKREVLVIASRLKRDRHEIAGRLMNLWEWCDENMDDVDFKGEDAIMSLGDRDAVIAFIDGQTGLSGMAEALESDEVGWLRIGKKVCFRKLRRHNGKTAKERATEQRKKSLQRGSKPDSNEEKPNVNGKNNVPPSAGRLPGPEQEQEQKHADAANALCIDREVQGGKDFSVVPKHFLSTLDEFLSILPIDNDQIAFFARLAYADATGFEWPKPILSYVGAAKGTRKRPVRNPAGYLTDSLRADLGPERWKLFEDSTPDLRHCASLVARAGRELSE